jgi:uncharacterized protein (DUF302 family)
MDDLQPVSYGTDSSPRHQEVMVSRFDFEETLVHLRQAIANADLWLIHEINPQMFLARGGYAIQPVRQLLYFHPRYVAKMLPIDLASFPEIPLKLVILQTPDGRVTVRHNTVESLLGRYPGLSDIVVELSALARSLLKSVA